MTDPQPTVLLVENDPVQADRVRAQLERRAPHCRVVELDTPSDMADYLGRRGPFSDPERSPLPHLVLLEIDLGGTTGFEVLDAVRAEPGPAHRVPVVVMSRRGSDADIDRAYRAHANSYLLKPVDDGELDRLLDLTRRYWLHWNRLPRQALPGTAHR